MIKFITGLIVGLLFCYPITMILTEATEYKLSECEKTCQDQWKKLRAINSDTSHKHCFRIGK